MKHPLFRGSRWIGWPVLFGGIPLVVVAACSTETATKTETVTSTTVTPSGAPSETTAPSVPTTPAPNETTPSGNTTTPDSETTAPEVETTTPEETAPDDNATSDTSTSAEPEPTSEGSGGAGTGGAAGVGATGGGTTSGGSTTGGGGTPTSTDPGNAGAGGQGTVAFTPGDYVSRRWARWPIPNPPTLELPNPMRYSETAEGVLDEVTGLVWQANTNTETTTWQEALAYCEGLAEGWSLPTRIELTSVLDNAVSGAKWNKEVFAGSAGWTWASTPWVVNERRGLTGDAALSWFINFAVGDSNNSLSQTAASAYARCVKLPADAQLPAEHYTVTAEVVTDNYTGLHWQRAHSGATAELSFESALDYCATLDLNGTGWRLPSLNELASLVDDVPEGDVSPAIDHAVFPDTAPDALYWSFSPYGSDSSEHWTLNFEDGFTAHDPNDTPGIARCVR